MTNTPFLWLSDYNSRNVICVWLKIIKGLLPFVATPFILVIYKKVKRVETSQFHVVLIKHTNCCIFKANENYILK